MVLTMKHGRPGGSLLQLEDVIYMPQLLYIVPPEKGRNTSFPVVDSDEVKQNFADKAEV